MLESRFWKNFDWILFGLAILLVAIGLIVIYSTSFKAANLLTPNVALSQLVFAVVSVIAMLLVSRFDYRSLSHVTPIMYGLMLASLLLVFVLGKTALGATRWIDFGVFQFQPSEFAKLVVIVVLAKYFSTHYDFMENPRHLAVSLLYAFVPALLVLMQPDLGTALVIGAIWVVMAIVARVRWTYLAALFTALVLAVPLLLPFLRPYQRARLEVFLNPAADPLHTGYNVVQSTITVGSGQLFGRGLAAGSQTQLNFLPSQPTDFIFAVLSEKMGFIGGLLVILLFAALMLRGVVIASRAADRFGLFMAVGIVTMLLVHVVINIGMNIGLMPVTGIPLPFVSYGGTSLLVSLLAIGLLQSIAVRRKKIQFGT
ncbi:MAG TPA: rod shape-determining protein RodA [Candidatus Polarisedimenticolaceae bacterium]|nr:rod shape-determining protein RodA [Candidatus Polarisedimenticolaceae bacterium]